ncbi:putative short-chain dehydrogenase [Lophiotrema nucula]|uniref:Putative short-chain dehydrogenase n=1 Tax=Lophiotrema nucula TaxID=690887 RepID=A0A6A5YVN8_9PLEO|nr:putative short-chain dehydrogenase [Lophiotrema nucula]
MSSAPLVAIILGAGANVGQHVSRAFAVKGYRIGLVARSLKEADSTADTVNISADFSDPSSIVKAFDTTRNSLGSPSVVIYNAGAASANPANDPLSLPLADFTHDLSINTTSAFVAAQQAVLAFEGLPEHMPKTFIYTGNILNTTSIPTLMSLGVGKSATARMIESAATAYQDRGFRRVFYYCDERKVDGSAAYFDIDGPAHAEFYVHLAGAASQGPWQQTFVKNVGYKQF